MMRYLPSSRLIARLSLSLLVFCLFAMHSLQLVPVPLLDQLERYAYDARVRLTMPNTVDPRIVILDIDEKSLSAEGQWPWPRDKLAELVTGLFDNYGVRVLGFDVVFAEPDRNRAVDFLDSLQQGPLGQHAEIHAFLEGQRGDLATDDKFAQALDGRDVVMGYVFKERVGADYAPLGELPEPLFTVGQLAAEGIEIPFPEAEGYTANLHELQQQAKQGGFFNNPAVDPDGVFRRVPLFHQFVDGIYSSLALEVARIAENKPPVKFGFGDGADKSLGLSKVLLGDRRIAVDETSLVYVPYRGRQGSFPYISATDVLNGSADIEVLFDSIVMLGTTAPGLLDLRSTPVGSTYAGVEVHANIVSGILDSRFKYEPTISTALELLLLAFVGLVLGLLMPRIGPILQLLLGFSLIAIELASNYWFWENRDYVLPIAVPVVYTLTVLLVQLGYEYFVESRRKRRLSRLFGQYIPAELVEEMDASDDEISLEGESRTMSVLFSDVRGFTGISEGLEPRELTRLMNEFLTPITRVIHENRGTIDKYMGDAVMAFWGAPISDEKHASHAIQAALDSIAELDELQANFSAKGWPEIKIGVGINTGEMNVGNMGSEFRMAYTVLGDTVNLGSRLEGITKQYGVQIIVSEFTAEAAPEYLYRELDRVQVKGRDEPVTIMEPVGLLDEVPDERKAEVQAFNAMLADYRAQDWDACEIVLKELSGNESAFLYSMYLERIATLRNTQLEADWNGVWAFTVK